MLSWRPPAQPPSYQEKRLNTPNSPTPRSTAKREVTQSAIASSMAQTPARPSYPMTPEAGFKRGSMMVLLTKVSRDFGLLSPSMHL